MQQTPVFGEQDMKQPPLKSIIRLLACVLAALPLLAAASTLERVRSSNSITLGFLPDAAPFSSQEGDQVSGYAIDLCLKVVDRLKTSLALPDLQVRYQPLGEADKFAAVSSGRVDILCSPSPESLVARKTVSFSVPVYTAGLAVMVRDDAPASLVKVLNGEAAHSGPTWRATLNQGLARHTYVTIAGGVTEDWIRQRQRLLGVVATLVTVDDFDAGVRLVAEGKADAFFAARTVLQHYRLKSQYRERLRVLERIFDYAPVAMALERGDEDFRLLVDTALSELYRSDELAQVYARYLGAPDETTQKLFKVYALP